MSQITPFVKRMRTQGGTMYTFSSAVEDIGLNINERNNIVKMSNFALLDIPEITAPINLEQNRFNTFAIDGAFKNYIESDSIKDGRVVIAESFQNYALNLETNLLAEDDYNPALLKTVSERVFWKWMKETGAVRWTKDVSNAGYWIEEIDTDSSVGYNSVIKYVGEISAGSVRTDTFGTYNETYVLVPTSHGQTRVYFKQTFDDNYYPNMKMGPSGINVLGREGYTQPHPDGLSLKADYDVIDSSVHTNTTPIDWTMSVDINDGASYQPGWWYSAQGQTFVDENWYATDVSTVLDDPSTYNYNLKYFDGISTNIEFQRSNVDALGIEYNINNLKTLFGDDTLTFDKMAIEDSVDDSFEFNAVLIYYTVYNQTLDKILATNLLGILFLDAPSGNTVNFPNQEIIIPTITKLQSTSTGFGSSYSFRINIKSDNMIDDTQATIFDESTSSQTALENWGSVFANLEKSLSILNAHTGTINYITDQYMDIESIQTQQGNTLTDLQHQINDLDNDLSNGTPGAIAMYAEGDDPLVDSSIYMNNVTDWIGIFTDKPEYPFHVDVSMKTMDITIENAVRDTSGNVILGYGSPLQLGASTNYREVDIYTGGMTPVVHIDTSNNIWFDASLVDISGGLDVSGNLTTSGEVNLSGDVHINGYLKEASLGNDFIWDGGYLDVSVGINDYLKESSIGSGLEWNAGLLDVSISSSGGGTGDVAWASGNVGTNNQLLTAAGDGSIVAESGITWSGSKMEMAGDLEFTNSVNRILSIAASSTTSRSLTIHPSDATGTNNAGSLFLKGGAANSGNSGGVSIEGGDSATGTGGTIRISAGTGTGPGGNGKIYIGYSGPGISSPDGSTFINLNSQVNSNYVTYDTASKMLGFRLGTSDIKYKTNLIKIPNALEKLNSINGYLFNFNNKASEIGYTDTSIIQSGVIAQEVETVFPEVISLINVPDSSENETFKKVDYEKLVPLLIEGIKELNQKINDLQAQVNTM